MIMSKRIREITFDTRKLGQAIRYAREQRELTREQLSEKLEITPRHLADIENYGKHPSIEVLYRVAILFNISIDQYIFPNDESVKSSHHRAIEDSLRNLSERELIFVESLIDGVISLKNSEK